MTKDVVAVLIAGVVVFSSEIPAHGGPRDLWIGVISYDFVEGRSATSRFHAGLEPVAAFVDGKWWFDDKNEPDAPHPVPGSVPAQWLPVGKELPATWQATLVDGRRVAIHPSGVLHVSGTFDHVVVATDLELPPLGRDDLDYTATGIAFAGDVDLRLFGDLPAAPQNALVRFLAPSIVQAERLEIAARASSDTADDLQKATAKVPDSRLIAAPFAIEIAKMATQRDGSRVDFIEGSRQLSGDGICQATRSGAAARRDRAGVLQVLGAWSYLVCNELYIAHEPLAVFERGGARCWLVAHQYEDGLEYFLSRPGRAREEQSACDIK
jgi:hypothetical protein